MGCMGSALAQGKVRLTIESWRNDDQKIWQETILPAFMKKYPNIEVVFAPTAPTEYNAVLDTKPRAGPPETSSPAAPSTRASSSSTPSTSTALTTCRA